MGNLAKIVNAIRELIVENFDVNSKGEEFSWSTGGKGGNNLMERPLELALIPNHLKIPR
jgi:hypothetical protein